MLLYIAAKLMNIFGITNLFPRFLFKRDYDVHLSSLQLFIYHHNSYLYVISTTVLICLEQAFVLCSAVWYLYSAVWNVRSAVGNVRTAMGNIKQKHYDDKIIIAIVNTSR